MQVWLVPLSTSINDPALSWNYCPFTSQYMHNNILNCRNKNRPKEVKKADNNNNYNNNFKIYMKNHIYDFKGKFNIKQFGANTSGLCLTA